MVVFLVVASFLYINGMLVSNLQDFGTTSSSILALHTRNGSGLSCVPHVPLVPGLSTHLSLAIHLAFCFFIVSNLCMLATI